MAYYIAAVSYTHLDVYKRQVWQTDYNEDESDKDSGSMDNHDDYNPDSEIDVIYDLSLIHLFIKLIE